MRQFLIFTLFIACLAVSNISGSVYAAESTTYSVDMQEEDNNSEPEQELRNRGHRSLARPIICEITPAGISISIDKSAILAYELWDETDDCIISTPDDLHFVNYLFTLEGDLILRIVTEEKTYIGFLTLH